MKWFEKYIWVVIGIAFGFGIAWAADTKLTALTHDASPGGDSLFYNVDDPGGTPVSRYSTIAEMLETTLGAAYDTEAELLALFAGKLATDGSGGSLTGIPLDSDFGSNGLMERTAEGVYGVATENTDYFAPGGAAGVSAAEFAYISTVTSNVQDQLDAKESSTSDNFDPDRLNGDSDDDNLIDADIIEPEVLRVTQSATTDANPYTLTPTTGYGYVHILLNNANADDNAIQLSETGATDMEIIVITNTNANTATYADISGQQEIPASISQEQYETVMFQYRTDRWVLLSQSTKALAFSTITTVETEYIPISACIDGAAPPAALETITSTNGKADVRKFAGDTTENDILTWKVPEDIDATSGIKIQIIFYITESTAPSNEGVSFNISGFSLGSGDALNGTFGTPVELDHTGMSDAQYDMIETAWSSALTSTNITNFAAGEQVKINIDRDHDDAADDYVQDIGIEGYNIMYKRDHDATF